MKTAKTKTNSANHQKNTRTKTKRPIYTNVKNFRQMEKLTPDRNPKEPRMRPDSEPTTMSRFSKGLNNKTPYGTHNTQNYDRYKTDKTSEEDAHKATQTPINLVYSEPPQNLEKLANFQDNDDIAKTYDEFLNTLHHKAGIKLQ